MNRSEERFEVSGFEVSGFELSGLHYLQEANTVLLLLHLIN